MHNLEFKAWCKPEKRMYDVFGILFFHGGIKVKGHGVKGYAVQIGNGWATKTNGCNHDCDVLLIPYTGYKDDNKRKIFGKDILKIHCFNNHRIGVNKERKGGVYRTPCGTWACCGYKLINILDRCEVIGNSLEHRSLLHT